MATKDELNKGRKKNLDDLIKPYKIKLSDLLIEVMLLQDESEQQILETMHSYKINDENKMGEKPKSKTNDPDEIIGQKMKDLSEKFKIDIHTVEEFFSHIRNYNKLKKQSELYKLLCKNKTLGVNMNRIYNEAVKNDNEKLKESKRMVMDDIDRIALQGFISRMPATRVSPGIIKYLEDNNVADDIINTALCKYVSCESNNKLKCDEIMKKLYQHNYKAQGNSPIDWAYNYYSACQEKDRETAAVEDIVRKNIKRMTAVKEQLTYCENTISSLKSGIMTYTEEIQNSVIIIEKLKRQAEALEHEGIFKRMFSKVKSFFKKDKPLLLPDSFDTLIKSLKVPTNKLSKIAEDAFIPESHSRGKTRDSRTKEVEFIR